jgi:hypothetical protein
MKMQDYEFAREQCPLSFLWGRHLNFVNADANFVTREQQKICGKPGSTVD